MEELVSVLLHSVTNAHILHLQTLSFAKHKALDDYYNTIGGNVDGLIESYQGRYGIIKQYQSSGPIPTDPVAYFNYLSELVEEYRKFAPQDSYIQNQIDGIVELIESTRYKLNNLA